MNPCPTTQEISDWVNGALGIPYVLNGRDRDGVDCFGFAVLFYRELYGIEIPDPVLERDAPFPVRLGRLSEFFDDTALDLVQTGDSCHCLREVDGRYCNHVMVCTDGPEWWAQASKLNGIHRVRILDWSEINRPVFYAPRDTLPERVPTDR